MKVQYEPNSDAERMARAQLADREICDSRVLEVMGRIPRHEFASGRNRAEAYGDFPVSIGQGQTMSQPYMVAYMTQALDLRGTEHVLEIGTGSGYQTAVLAELAGTVHTVERNVRLSERAQELLLRLGYTNIVFEVGDGSGGLEQYAPFDRIMVTAAAPAVPARLKAQLTDNGILVAPVGDYRTYQTLTVVRRIGADYETKESIGCRFVPLIGKNGFEGD